MREARSKFHLDDSKTEENLPRKRYLLRDLNYKHQKKYDMCNIEINVDVRELKYRKYKAAEDLE